MRTLPVFILHRDLRVVALLNPYRAGVHDPALRSVKLLGAFGTGSPFLKARKPGSAIDADGLLIVHDKSEPELEEKYR